MLLDEMLGMYPYPEKVEKIKGLMVDNLELLNAGYNRIYEQGQVKKHQFIVDFNVWSFMACDKALEESERKNSPFLDELKRAIRESGSN